MVAVGSQTIQCTIRPELIEFDKNTRGDFYLTVIADPGNSDTSSSNIREPGFLFMNSTTAMRGQIIFVM